MYVCLTDCLSELAFLDDNLPQLFQRSDDNVLFGDELI